jgi:hypothetical protein
LHSVGANEVCGLDRVLTVRAAGNPLDKAWIRALDDPDEHFCLGLQPTKQLCLIQARRRLTSVYDLRIPQSNSLRLPGPSIRAVSLAELTFLDRHAIPLIMMFDNVSQDFLSGKRKARTGEEKRLSGLQKAVREMRSIERLIFVPFEEPDILCALPNEVLQRTLERHWPEAASSFPGWEEVKGAWSDAGSPPDFKVFFAETVGLQLPRERP